MGFILYEFQGKWIAGVLSGRIGLPPEEEMMRDVEALYLSLQASATPKRCTHSIADYRVNLLLISSNLRLYYIQVQIIKDLD